MDLNFADKLAQVRKWSAGVPKKIDIDLSVAAVDQVYDIAGDLLYVWNAPDDNSYIDIRINETREPNISYYRHTGQHTPFYRLYITTPAGQTGTITLLYGTETPELMKIIDNRSATSAAIGDLLDELRGDITEENWGTEITVGNGAAVVIIAANADRKDCIIQAKSTNMGIVYLGFDNTVTTTKWIAELTAGQAFTVDDYRGDLYTRASAAGQLVGWGEW